MTEEKKVLVQWITPAPNAGVRDKLSPAAAEFAIKSGFAREVFEEDPANLSRCENVTPPERWSVVRGGQYGEKLFMRHDNGHGGFTLYDKVPAPIRCWIFDQSSGDDGHYENRAPVEIPQEVLAEFERLGGAPADPLADADRATIARERQQKAKFEAARQGKLEKSFLTKLAGGR